MMLVGKKIIGFGLEQLCYMFPEFDRHIKNKGLDETVDVWHTLFKKVDIDYDLAEQDFKDAIFMWISQNNKSPYFSDIIIYMNNIKNDREIKGIMNNIYG